MMIIGEEMIYLILLDRAHQFHTISSVHEHQNYVQHLRTHSKHRDQFALLVLPHHLDATKRRTKKAFSIFIDRSGSSFIVPHPRIL